MFQDYKKTIWGSTTAILNMISHRITHFVAHMFCTQETKCRGSDAKISNVFPHSITCVVNYMLRTHEIKQLNLKQV